MNYPWLAELEELEAAGWGDVPQERIPKNWRELDRNKRRVSPLAGAKKKLAPCLNCGVEFGVREMRLHRQGCR